MLQKDIFVHQKKGNCMLNHGHHQRPPTFSPSQIREMKNAADWFAKEFDEAPSDTILAAQAFMRSCITALSQHGCQDPTHPMILNIIKTAIAMPRAKERDPVLELRVSLSGEHQMVLIADEEVLEGLEIAPEVKPCTAELKCHMPVAIRYNIKVFVGNLRELYRNQAKSVGKTPQQKDHANE